MILVSWIISRAHECILRLHDLVVAVVGIRKHGRPGGDERQTLI